MQLRFPQHRSHPSEVTDPSVRSVKHTHTQNEPQPSTTPIKKNVKLSAQQIKKKKY